jgi:hypothetical protein
LSEHPPEEKPREPGIPLAVHQLRNNSLLVSGYQKISPHADPKRTLAFADRVALGSMNQPYFSSGDDQNMKSAMKVVPELLSASSLDAFVHIGPSPIMNSVKLRTGVNGFLKTISPFPL